MITITFERIVIREPTVHGATQGLDQVCYAMALDPPNYPMPAIRYEVELQFDRVILWRKQYTYWEFMYLASTIPTKLLHRWSE